MKTNPPALSPFVRAYLITALWSSRDEFHFTRKAAQDAGWGVHSETVDGREMWVAVASGENGADFLHEIEFESDAWRAAAKECGAGRQDDTPLDRDFSVTDFSPEGMTRALADCEKFQADNAETIAAAISEGVTCGPDFGPEERGGHDFWLSRNGHGAGFFDGDWPEPYGDKLQDAARAFGELHPYVDGNGQISFE